MRYLLDSNIVIAASLGIGVRLRSRLVACNEGDLATSAIVYAEVMYGAERRLPPSTDALELFLEEVPVLDFDRAAAETYARLPFRRGSYDRLIAAHALSQGLTVITDNVRDFADVPGLQVENWAA